MGKLDWHVDIFTILWLISFYERYISVLTNCREQASIRCRNPTIDNTKLLQLSLLVRTRRGAYFL